MWKRLLYFTTNQSKIMKKNLLLLTIFLMAGAWAQAQNVGIGTSVPISKLHVVDNSAVTSKLRVESNNTPIIASIAISNTVRAGGISMGYVNNLNTYGDPGETYIYSSNNMEGLNIINRNNSGNGHIAFFSSGDHADVPTLYLSDNDRVGIGNDVPTEALHVTGGARVTNLSGAGTRMVVADANGVLNTQAIPAGGDITAVNAGAGITGGGTTGAVTLTAAADNGLYVNAGADRIRMGGALVEATTITQGGFNMVYNLNGTGDFHIQDAGVNHLSVTDDGRTTFGEDTYWRDINTGGTIIGRFYDAGDDGVFQVYRDGGIQHSINSVGATVFNEQSFDVDFRVESNGNANMLVVNGGTNRVGIGTGNPGEMLHINNGDILMTSGRSIETQAGDQNIQLDDANPTWNGDAYGGVTRFFGDGTLNRSKLEAGGLQLERRIQIRGGGPSAGALLMSQDGNGNATWSTAGYGMVPIGSIIGWHGNMAGVPGLPTGWLECNGQTVADAASPLNGQVVPNLNNGTTSASGDASRGRFLRGNTTSGFFQNEQTNNLSRWEQDDSDGGPNRWEGNLDQSGGWNGFMGSYHSNDRRRFRLRGVETRVTNMSVRWIIRVK